jgi:pseudouridine synthase
MPLERLQKVLSRAGLFSRRHAEAAILSGRVKVNHQIIQQLGEKVDPITDLIEVDGVPIPIKKTFHYYKYYKPRGLVVSKRDELGRETIYSELGLPPEVNSVGRLDKDSEGLLLLTDDGELIQKYTHPSFQIPKIYHVLLSRAVSPQEKDQLLKGVEVEQKKVRAFKIKKIFPNAWGYNRGNWIEIEIREGIKREIRRMFQYFGNRVLRLIRIQHGKIKLGTMKSGQVVPLKTEFFEKDVTPVTITRIKQEN